MNEALIAENTGLVYKMANYYRPMLKIQCAVDLDDLTQAGYLGLLAAAETYKPGAGKNWAGWACWYIRTEMRRALGIQKGFDPIPLSLDAPLDEDGDMTIGDMIADSSAIDPQEAAEKSDLCRRIREQINALPPLQKAVVHFYDLREYSMRQTEAATGLSEMQVRCERVKAMRHLRRSCKKLWQECRPDYYHWVKGVTAFQRDHSSVVEDAILWREAHL